MSTLPAAAIRELLSPYLAPPNLTDALIGQLSIYLDLLVRWNGRVSLTAIHRPEEMVQRHFGESLFTGEHLARHLRPGAALLDYGSGAGFPGLPIQLLLPNIRVTLAESQARKVAFLREVIRVLGLESEVWPRRVQEVPASRRFDAITLRAVDRMALSLNEASRILQENGWLAALVGRDVDRAGAQEFMVPESEHRRLLIWRNVPRGTFGV